MSGLGADGDPAGAIVEDALDLRLAIGAAAAWSAILLCRHGSARTALAAAILAAALGSAALVRWHAIEPGDSLPPARRWAQLGSVLALAGWCVAGVLGPLGMRLHATEGSPIRALAAASTSVVAEISIDGDPQPLAAGPSGAGRVVIDATIREVVVGARRSAVRARVVVFAPSATWNGLLPGQRVRADARVNPSDDPLEVASLSISRPPELLGRPPPWQRAAGRIRAGLHEASSALPDPARGLLPGLVVGDTSGLDPVLAQRFKTAGLTHLVAVSGANCVIVAGAVLLTARRLRAPPWLAALAAALALVGFVIVARPSPSVLRAALMAGIALAALAVGRPRAGLPIVAAAALVVLGWHPEWAGQAGFAMSVLATGALLIIAPGWAASLRRRRVPPVLAESIAVAAAAHLVTAPLIVLISGRLSLVAIPANVLAEPAVAPATILGVLAALLSLVWMPAASAAAWLAGWPVRWLVRIADSFGGLSGASVGWPESVTGAMLLVALILLIVAAVRVPRLRPSLAAAGVIALIVQMPLRHVITDWPPRHWLIVACDVGQGDGLVLPAGRHAAVVIDTGPDPVAEDRCLRDLHIESIPLLIISHLHMDHVGGIDGALRGRPVGAVLTGPLDQPEAGLSVAEHALTPRHLQLRVGRPGMQMTVGAVQLTVLGPDVAYHGTRSDPNNSSLVLRAEVGGHSIMLPGDAELDAQQSLLSSGIDLRADILKVPHHGSAYSDPRFLKATGARVGLISVGAHNDYGLPAPTLLSTLAQLAVPAFRTDRDGDIAVRSSDSATGLSAVHRAERRVPGAAPLRQLSPGPRPVPLSVVRDPPHNPFRDRLSARGDKMRRWSIRHSTSRRGAPARDRVLRSSSVRRSSSLPGPSSRSPPQSGRSTARRRSPSGSAPGWCLAS